jgi:hypothetical protein
MMSKTRVLDPTATKVRALPSMRNGETPMVISSWHFVLSERRRRGDAMHLAFGCCHSFDHW